MDNNKKLIQQKLNSCISEVDRLEEEIKKAWDEIKDFTVSANKAETGYKRIAHMRGEIKSLKTSIRKLSSKL